MRRVQTNFFLLPKKLAIQLTSLCRPSMKETACFIIVLEKNNEIVKSTKVLKILAMFEPQTLPGISKPLRPLRRTTRLCDSTDSILKNLFPFFSEIHSRKTGNSIKQEVFVGRATIKPLVHAVLSVENTSVHVLRVTTAAGTLATAIVSISMLL